MRARLPCVALPLCSPSPFISPTRNCPHQRMQLKELGPIDRPQLIVAGSVLLTVALWVGGAPFGFNTVTSAVVGMGIILCAGVIKARVCAFMSLRG